MILSFGITRPINYYFRPNENDVPLYQLLYCAIEPSLQGWRNAVAQ